jgi:hypothetical protein
MFKPTMLDQFTTHKAGMMIYWHIISPILQSFELFGTQSDQVHSELWWSQCSMRWRSEAQQSNKWQKIQKEMESPQQSLSNAFK